MGPHFVKDFDSYFHVIEKTQSQRKKNASVSFSFKAHAWEISSYMEHD